MKITTIASKDVLFDIILLKIWCFEDLLDFISLINITNKAVLFIIFILKMIKEKIILGIDPGTNIMGYGVIQKRNDKIDFLCLDVILLNKITDHNLKLKKIFEKTSEIIKSFSVNEMAVEAPFFGKNPQSMLKLGRAQGAAMTAGIMHNIPITEYAPKKIKMAITGNGTSSKEQVAGMLMNMLSIHEKPKYLDATDGLAAAMCHALQKNNLKTGNKQSWEQYIKSNPNRIN